MLKRLEALHADLLELIAALERLSHEGAPRMEALADVRLKLTRAGRRRAQFLETVVYPLVAARGTAIDQQKISALSQEGVSSRMNSTRHISLWTPAHIQEDWRAYWDASADMRASMRSRIEQERAILVPILMALDEKQT
jgi:hypothetical protein